MLQQCVDGYLRRFAIPNHKLEHYFTLGEYETLECTCLSMCLDCGKELPRSLVPFHSCDRANLKHSLAKIKAIREQFAHELSFVENEKIIDFPYRFKYAKREIQPLTKVGERTTY